VKLPEFEDLPFYERPDLTPYLIHLTKNSQSENGHTAFENLVSILKCARIRPSTTDTGYIRGRVGAACFTDVPFSALKYILNTRNTDRSNPRYEPYGVFVTKSYAYKADCRPVLYLSNPEIKKFQIPEDELWRVVRFEVSDNGWISWLHEREWRCAGEFHLPQHPFGVLVRTAKEAEKLGKLIHQSPNRFKAKPRSIIPLSVLCQGLPKAD
jgi:hypothetical protein